MAKSFETTVEIKGAIGSSFTNAFKNATGGLVDLRQETRAVQQELDRLGKDFRQGKIHQSQYTEETRKLTKELNSLENAQKKQAAAQQRMDSAKTFVSNGWNKTKAIAGTVGVGATVAAAATAVSSVKTAAEFEAQMSKVAAKTQATSQEMAALQQTALKLGASTSLSASEVALSMDELAAKGLDAKAIIAAMPGIIAGAEASSEDLTLVSDVVTSAINAFGMSAEEASRVADIMSMSANNTAAGVQDLGYAFKYAAPIANTLGYSIEDLAAATGILIDKGLAGEQAGTTLRAALTRLSAPTKAAQKVLDKLGISVVGADKKFKSLAEITDEWNKATADLADTQKIQYASTVFGTEAASGMLNIFGAGPKVIDEMTKALENSSGAAEKASKAMKDNLLGANEQLLGAIDTAKIAFATPSLSVLGEVFNGISYSIENNLPTIENAGKAVAQVLDDITAPFQVTEKPIKPQITPEMSFSQIDELMLQYQKEMEKYELYGNMNFGDKIVYSLDEAGEKIETWLGGEGGEVVEEVFSELGTIAGKAWLNSFTTAATGAIGELTEGNVAGAVGLGIFANMLTGGLLVKGGLYGGKKGYEKAKEIYTNKKSDKATADPTTVDDNKDKKDESTKKETKASATVVEDANKESAKTPEKETERRATRSAKHEDKGFLKEVGKYGKIASKAFVPLTILTTAYDLFTADDKSKAISSAAGSGLGGWGGAAAGAAIGSVIPGLGTVAGGIVGALLGSAGGGVIGEKLHDWFGGLFNESEKASASPIPVTENAVSVDFSVLNTEVAKATENASLLTQYLGQASGMIYGSFYPLQEETNIAGKNMSILTSYTGQASGMIYGSFYPLQEETKLVTRNMSTLASYTGQASGWINSLSNIQVAGQRVVSALNNLEERINNLELPQQANSSRRTSYSW